MKYPVVASALVALCLSLSNVVMAADAGLEELREELETLKSDYERRIAALEQRVAVAEQNSRRANLAESAPAVTSVGGAGSAAFNPAIGVIFSGNAWSYESSTENYAVQGFPYGGEAGPASEGLSLGETELIMSANVDDKFTAMLTAALAIEDGAAELEVEEAWVEATALPAGFGLRFGRFFSAIGYLNSKHAHSWDFADQPLPYQAFLAGQLRDDGIQARWLAPTDIFLELGGEWLRGESFPASGAANTGNGSYSLFANVGGDVGTGSSWLAGISYLDASAVDRVAGDEDDPYVFNGDSKLSAAHFVWKWAPNGNWKARNLVLQAEVMRRSETGTYAGPALAATTFDADQSGWYAQAVYQPIPRWRVGVRWDRLSADNPGAAFDGTILAASDNDPERISIMADWANSEFSRLRLQFTSDDAGPANDNQIGLQYFHSIGAHGAHTF